MTSVRKDGTDALMSQKIQKLQEQKILSDQMHTLLNKSGGLLEGNKLARKSLQAAIAVSKQPGYFHYYTPTNEVLEIENNKILNALARKISSID